MKFIRRVLLVLGIAGAAGAVLRLKGRTGDTPQQGGWRQVTPPTDRP